jgi:hypothetical protein
MFNVIWVSIPVLIAIIFIYVVFLAISVVVGLLYKYYQVQLPKIEKGIYSSINVKRAARSKYMLSTPHTFLTWAVYIIYKTNNNNEIGSGPFADLVLTIIGKLVKEKVILVQEFSTLKSELRRKDILAGALEKMRNNNPRLSLSESIPFRPFEFLRGDCNYDDCKSSYSKLFFLAMSSETGEVSWAAEVGNYKSGPKGGYAQFSRGSKQHRKINRTWDSYIQEKVRSEYVSYENFLQTADRWEVEVDEGDYLDLMEDLKEEFEEHHFRHDEENMAQYPPEYRFREEFDTYYRTTKRDREEYENFEPRRVNWTADGGLADATQQLEEAKKTIIEIEEKKKKELMNLQEELEKYKSGMSTLKQQWAESERNLLDENSKFVKELKSKHIIFMDKMFDENNKLKEESRKAKEGWEHSMKLSDEAYRKLCNELKEAKAIKVLADKSLKAEMDNIKKEETIKSNKIKQQLDKLQTENKLEREKNIKDEVEKQLKQREINLSKGQHTAESSVKPKKLTRSERKQRYRAAKSEFKSESAKPEVKPVVEEKKIEKGPEKPEQKLGGPTPVKLNRGDGNKPIVNLRCDVCRETYRTTNIKNLVPKCDVCIKNDPHFSEGRLIGQIDTVVTKVPTDCVEMYTFTELEGRLGYGIFIRYRSKSYLLFNKHFLQHAPSVVKSTDGVSKGTIDSTQAIQCDTHVDFAVIPVDINFNSTMGCKSFDFDSLFGRPMDTISGLQTTHERNGIWYHSTSTKMGNFLASHSRLEYGCNSEPGDCGSPVYNQSGVLVGIHDGSNNNGETNTFCIFGAFVRHWFANVL